MGELKLRTFKADDEFWDAAQAKAGALGVSTAELVRRAVEAYGQPGEPAAAVSAMTDGQRAELAKQVTRDSVSTWYDEPFGVARTHVPHCNGMVLYWRDQRRWRW